MMLYSKKEKKQFIFITFKKFASVISLDTPMVITLNMIVTLGVEDNIILYIPLDQFLAHCDNIHMP